MKRKLLVSLLFIGLLFNALLVRAQCVVTNISSDMAVAGSLKWAINGCAAGGTITFNIPGAGPHIIPIVAGAWPNGPLGIDKQLTIDGTNLAPGGGPIRIDGQGVSNAFSIGWWAGAPAPGAAGTIIRDLTIINCTDGISVGPVRTGNITIENCYIGITEAGVTGPGITNSGHGIIFIGNTGDPTYAAFEGTPINAPIIRNNVISGNLRNGAQFQFVSNGTITNNKIGTNPAGTACVTTGSANEVGGAGGNGYDGLNISNSSGFTISNNVISCNGNGDVATSPLGKRGLYLENADNNIIIGNKIGTDIAGNIALPNYKSGILLSQDSDGNRIGGPAAADQNVISGNGLNTGGYATVQDKHGIVIDWGGTQTPSDNNTITNNRIGIAANGTCLGNDKNGIEVIGEGTGNIIGGATAAAGNIIGCNGENGVSIGMGSNTNTIQNNYIGTDAAGTDRGNGNNGILFSSAGSTVPFIPAMPLTGNIINNNVIGFNDANGIQTFGPEEIDGIDIKGNYIGIDRSGRNIANDIDGILIETELTNIEIGGTAVADRNFISYNDGIGINIAPGSNTNAGTNNQIRNNYIGVNLTGNAAAPNGGTGITINENSENITIGGTTANTSNIIAGNGGDGIFITGTNVNNINVQQNNIGVGANGTTVVANSGYGVQVDDASGTVTIGGSAAGANNIFGNTLGGILVNGTNTLPTTNISFNTIGNATTPSNGNAITIAGGVNAITTNDIFNYADNGINITNGISTVTGNDIYDNTVGIFLNSATATGNIIGNATTGNNIHENSSHGIALAGGANNNTISNNQIGTAGKNDGNGIHLDGAVSNTINGGNVIVNHDAAGQYGVYISNNSNTNLVAGNFIGTNAIGAAGLGNENGIMIDGSRDNFIGGTAAADKNSIAGNDQNGIIIQGATSTGNQVLGNNIGLNLAGTQLANGANGIIIQNGANANIIGGTAAGAGNTISGNTLAGIQISNANNNDVLGNKIGTNPAGTAPIANGTSGISITGSTGNEIGNGTVAGSNIISGNTQAGVLISGGSANTVSGNIIGANAAGSGPLGNGTDGININASTSNTINGNLLAGNTQNGITLTTGANTNTLTNNFIGSNPAGTIITNGDNGVFVFGSNGTVIGTTGNGNTISGNTEAGIFLDNGDNSTIRGNFIGTNSAGTATLGNDTGIIIENGSTGNTIGGPAIADRNIIAYNTLNGIQVNNGTSTGNIITKNSMYCNGLLGISETDGNDEFLKLQLDNVLNRPEIFNNSSIRGTFTLVPGLAGAIVEVFKKDDDGCDDCATRTKDGKEFIISGTVDGTGNYDITLPSFVIQDSASYIITVTSTTNNTSEFSLCSTIKCIKPDVAIDPLTPAPVCAGNTVTLTALGGTKGNLGALFTWYEAANPTTPLDGFEVLNDSVYVATVSGDYFVTVRNGSCDSTTNPVTVIIGEPVTFTVTQSVSACDVPDSLIISGLDPGFTNYVVSFNNPTLVTLPAAQPTAAGIIALPLPNGTYTNIMVDSAGCNAVDPGPYVLDSLETPNATTTFADPTTCLGTDGRIYFAGLVAGKNYTVNYTYTPVSGSPAAAAPITFIPATVTDSIVGLSAGDYLNITIQIDAACPQAIPNITLTDPTPPVLTITPFDPTTCGGNEGKLAIDGLTGGETYTYTVTSPALSGTFNPVAPAFSDTIPNLAAGTYSGISVTWKNCPIALTNQVLTDPTPPVLTATSADPTTCGGTDGEITISGLTIGESYTYTITTPAMGPTPFTASATTFDITGLAEGTYSGISVNWNSCIISLLDQTLTDPTPPTITASGTNPTICQASDGSVTISGLAFSTNYSLEYLDDATSVGPSPITSNGAGEFVIGTLNAGTYSQIAVTINGCKSNEVSANLTDPGTPIITVTSTSPTQCSGTDGTITIRGLVTGTSYDYSYILSGITVTVPSVSAVAPGNIVITGLGAGAYSSIKVTLSGTVCESNALTATLTDPLAPTYTVTPTSPNQCNVNNGQIVLSALPAGTYSVTYDLGGAAQLPVAGSGPTITIGSLGVGTYTNIVVTNTVTNCATTNAGPFTLTPPPTPTFTLGGSNPTVCGGNGQLILSGFPTSPILTYQLTYNNPAAVGPTSITPNSSGVVTIPAPAGSYTNVVVTLNNCPSLPASFTLVPPVEVPEVNLSGPSQICEGTNATFTATPVRGQGASPTYAWTVNGDPQSETGNTLQIANLPVGNNVQVRVVMTSSSPCAVPTTDDAIRTINVLPTPVAGIIGSTKICAGQSTTLSATGGISGSTYQWYRDGNPLSNTNLTTLNASIPGVYSVEITNGGQCSNTFGPHPLEVISVSVNAGADKDVKVPGDVFTFLLEGRSNGNSPRWDLIQGSGTITNPQVVNSPASLGIGINKLMLTDSVGSCRASDEVVIRVRGQIWIPTAISPNGDGSNDAWFIGGLESYDKYTIRVYNRYGSKVYESEDTYTPWDGTRNGEPMPVATYYYVIEVKDDKNYQGPLTIMR